MQNASFHSYAFFILVLGHVSSKQASPEKSMKRSNAIQRHALFSPLPNPFRSENCTCSMFSASRGSSRRSLRSCLRSARRLLCCFSRRHLCVVGIFSRAAAAAEGEDQVQCRAAFEGVLFGGLVVGPGGKRGGLVCCCLEARYW